MSAKSTATDGAFNSQSEAYSCAITGVDDGVRNIYVRSYDTNGSYTAPTSYTLASFTKDTKKPSKIKIGLAKNDLHEIEEDIITIYTQKPKFYFDTYDKTTDVKFIMMSERKDFRGQPWKRYDGGHKFEFSSEGEKTLYVRFKDDAGNRSNTYAQKFNIKNEADKEVIATENNKEMEQVQLPTDTETTEITQPTNDTTTVTPTISEQPPVEGTTVPENTAKKPSVWDWILGLFKQR